MSVSFRVRHAGGTSAIDAGDAFVFKPNEPHELLNNGNEDPVYYVVADNPVGESCYYPDSNKWEVKQLRSWVRRGPSTTPVGRP
jgi:uncharacterized cupin superfamily protein